MAEADAIMQEIGDYVFQLPVEQGLVGTQDEIQAVCAPPTAVVVFGWVLQYEQNVTI
jgi:hypothetical protein